MGVAVGVAIWSGIVVEHISLLSGSNIHLGALALPLTFVWIIGITNALNLVDGLDGLAAGLAIIAAGSIGFLDDDPRLQGRKMNRVPILGSVADLGAIIAARSVSCLIVSSRQINGGRLGQALSVCQEWSIPVLQAHLTLEPVALVSERTNGVARVPLQWQDTSHPVR